VRRFIKLHMIVALIALVAIPPALTAGPVSADDQTVCAGVDLAPGVYENVEVTGPGICTMGVGVDVTGNVKVLPGGFLSAFGSSIEGNVQGDGGIVQLTDMTVGGNVQIKGATAANSGAVSSTIGGDFKYEESSGQAVAFENTIGGNLQAIKNTGGAAGFSFTGNMVGGVIQCKDNVPVFAQQCG